SPLIRAERLGAAVGVPRLWIKDDTGLPTGSLKDRASALVVAKAVEYGRSTVTTASTGNAAVAMAAMCAAAGLRAVIFCPASAPPAKLAQMLAFGATVLPVDGTYDDAYALSIEATREFGWYNRSTAYNPFTIEGKKTVAFEIREQIGRDAPDAVVIPTGDGVILAGVHKGFADLRDMGLVTRMPRLIAAQAEGSAAIRLSLSEPGDDVRALDEARTPADSIRVAIPAAGRWAKRAIRETSGAAVTVSDDEILRAIGLLGSTTGVFAEPASAAAIAAVVKGAAVGAIGRDETVVALVTGTGLKDVAAAMRIAATPRPIEPTIDAVRRRLDENGRM
ncbi:MAG: threonine synthase, partial [Myxococcota bacterium]|nr:threonine synthase [Myxococcota bacterium]